MSYGVVSVNERMKYWLMKSEPSCYSIDDLRLDGVGAWDDVRNYQARNFMRDMKNADMVLFYHSSTDPIGIVGIAEIAREAYPDPTQFDTKSYKCDPKSTTDNPRWVSVDLKFKRTFDKPLTLNELKLDPFFTDMLVVKRGMRLSVQPVAGKHFNRIVKMRS
jgi:predicted RNA-binding protein with PUA-like domain